MKRILLLALPLMAMCFASCEKNNGNGETSGTNTRFVKTISGYGNDFSEVFGELALNTVEFEYDSFGYIASSNREATNLLVIPSYNVIVACINERYTLLNASGEQPIRAFVDDIYMVISGGEKQYLMTANDRTYDVEEYLDRLGVLDSTSNTNNTNTSSSNTTTDNEENNNQVNNETTEENSEQNNNEQQNNGESQNNEEQQSNEQTQNGEEQQGEAQ